jgi:uncharacterized membrane protein YgcG
MCCAEIIPFPVPEDVRLETQRYVRGLESFIESMQSMADHESNADRRKAAQARVNAAKNLYQQRFDLAMSTDRVHMRNFIVSAKQLLGNTLPDAEVLDGPRPVPQIFKKDGS